MPIPFQKVILLVLDGFGLAERGPGNAILAAGMPALDVLIKEYPTLAVAASGLVVGLPWGQPGNSEVGHSAIGTGRIVIQDLAHINSEIRNGGFYKNPALMEVVAQVKRNNTSLHLIGCTSAGGIHSHLDHLIALLELARRNQVSKVFVHVITDGQDMPANDGINVLDILQPFLVAAGARIASLQGRSFAMDRVLNWTLTEKVWHSIVVGDAPAIADAAEYLKTGYAAGFNDYSIEPATVTVGDTPVGAVGDGDAVVFFDFRNDRVKQLVTPFVAGSTFNSFERIRTPKNVIVVTMTKYAEEFSVPVAYPAGVLPNTLGEIVADKGWNQWRIAEKEKEAHVTNFFNGGRITAFPGEERVVVPSRMMKGKEYAQHPEMSAQQIVDKVIEKMQTDARLIIVNIANPDMIAHSGDMAGATEALRVTDDCIRQLVEKLRTSSDTALVITSDHGNAEELLDPNTGGEDTQHSTRNVPAIFVVPGLVGSADSGKSLESLAQEAPIGTLVDIAPTILYLLGLEKPLEMSGSRLITL